MPGPGHVEPRGQIERELRALGLELVEDEAVVDPADPRLLSVPLVPELASALFDFRRVDRPHAPELLGEREVDGRLLPRRVEIEEHDLLGSEPREDRLADDAFVAGGVEAGEVPVEPMAVRADVRELLALGDLEGVERRERLELDQLRNERSAGVLRDREVGDGEDRQLVAAGHVEPLRHGGERPLKRLRASRAGGRSRARPRPSRRAAPAAGRPASRRAGRGSPSRRAPRAASRRSGTGRRSSRRCRRDGARGSRPEILAEPAPHRQKSIGRGARARRLTLRRRRKGRRGNGTRRPQRRARALRSALSRRETSPVRRRT